MGVNWYNPYAEKAGNWFKGNLHSHCIPESPCASIDLYQLLTGYIEKGYDFLSVSDHLAVTITECHEMTLIPGIEWNSRAGYMPNGTQTQFDHIGVYGSTLENIENTLESRTLPELLEKPNGDLLHIANHPDWLPEEHFSVSILQRFADQIDGIEIYNFSLEADDGQADTTWKWDRLLSMGYKLLGFSHDDSHSLYDIGKAWIMVNAPENSKEHLLNSMKRGNFYCSTGVHISHIDRADDTLYIALNHEGTIRVIGMYGRVLKEIKGRELEWTFNGAQSSYARFHIRDTQWKQAWTQPFFQDNG